MNKPPSAAGIFMLNSAAGIALSADPHYNQGEWIDGQRCCRIRDQRSPTERNMPLHQLVELKGGGLHSPRMRLVELAAVEFGAVGQ